MDRRAGIVVAEKSQPIGRVSGKLGFGGRLVPYEMPLLLV
jgi:hypothetical protein